jgi:hypothetical protein
MENRQTRGEVLVIRRVAGDQVRSGFNNGFVDVRGFDAVIELNVSAVLPGKSKRYSVLLPPNPVRDGFCRD